MSVPDAGTSAHCHRDGPAGHGVPDCAGPFVQRSEAPRLLKNQGEGALVLTTPGPLGPSASLPANAGSGAAGEPVACPAGGSWAWVGDGSAVGHSWTSDFTVSRPQFPSWGPHLWVFVRLDPSYHSGFRVHVISWRAPPTHSPAGVSPSHSHVYGSGHIFVHVGQGLSWLVPCTHSFQHRPTQRCSTDAAEGMDLSHGDNTGPFSQVILSIKPMGMSRLSWGSVRPSCILGGLLHWGPILPMTRPKRGVLSGIGPAALPRPPS